MAIDSLLNKALIVGAHPDDEILWFSSILEKVDRTIICFLECKSKPEWTNGRIKSLKEYPIKNLSCLRLTESEVFNLLNFHDPVMTKYGIKIAGKPISEKLYLENFKKLKKKLRSELKYCENVFTHNPWGEYGNEEHIQLFRVIESLKNEIGFNLWFSNYASNKSYKLMLKYITNAKLEHITLKTNRLLSEHIKKIYIKNGCWTWYENWEWFHEETFIKDDQLENGTYNYGHTIPINLVNVPIFKESKKNPFRQFRLIRRFAFRKPAH